MSDAILTHKQAVQARRAFSHEPRWEVEYAVRGRQIGFDRCSGDAQRRMRAHLAVFLLNDRPYLLPHHFIESTDDAGRLSWQDTYGLMVNRPVFSPRHNDFAILTDIPGHLVRKVVNFPGIRLHQIDQDQHALILRHLPTSGMLSFRYSPPGNPKFPQPCHVVTLVNKVDFLHTEQHLIKVEVDALRALPPISESAEQLLAALVSRLWLSSHTEQWAVGGLIHDPLERARPPVHPVEFSYCWGNNNDWVIRWGGQYAVPPADVARALTHPIVGLDGVQAFHSGTDRCEVTLGNAKLRFERHFVPSSWRHGGAA